MKKNNFFEIIGITLWMLVFITPVAHAYVDPGTGSLIWQFILAAFFGMLFYLRKIKKIVLSLFSKRTDED